MSRRRKPLRLKQVKIMCSCQGKPHVVATEFVDQRAADEAQALHTQTPAGDEGFFELLERYRAAVRAIQDRDGHVPLIRATDAEKRLPDGIHFERAGVDEDGADLVQATPEWTCDRCGTSVRPNFARGVIEALAEAGVLDPDLRALARTLLD